MNQILLDYIIWLVMSGNGSKTGIHQTIISIPMERLTLLIQQIQGIRLEEEVLGITTRQRLNHQQGRKMNSLKGMIILDLE